MDKQKTQGKRMLPRYLSLICLVLVAVVAMNSIIDAKYVTSRRDDPAAVAQAFYFESDLLKADSTPTYNLPAGTTEISFVLRNYTDALRYADTDIAYTVTLSGASDESKTGTLVRNASKVTENQIAFTGLSTGTYTVTAKATSPYTETLQATFVIPEPEGGLEYDVNDTSGSPIARLTVRTNNFSGNVTITWPSGVSPDNTDPLLRSASGSSATIKFANDAEYTFVFFKSSHANVYTRNDIQATK